MGYDKNGNYDYTEQAARGMFAPNYHSRVAHFLQNAGRGLGCILAVLAVIAAVIAIFYGMFYVGARAVSSGVNDVKTPSAQERGRP